MTYSVQAAHVAHAIHKCTLANQLIGHTELPEQALSALFGGVMEGLEKRANAKFSPPLQESVWRSVSPQYVNALKRTIIGEVSSRIFTSFQQHEILHLKADDPRFHAIFPQQDKTIVNAVLQRTNALVPDFVADTIQAIGEQGITVPPPYGPSSAE